MDPASGSNHYKPDDVQKWVEQTLAGLQLPHMPRPSNSDEEPTIQILLVSDVDLASASALAEFTLLQDNKVFDASRIDLCIACGPFCHDEDMIPYLKGKQRKNYHKLYDSEVDSSNPSWSSSVFFRSPEETAALEGLVTAAISQLESIVCRVVFCPGSSDPLTSSTLSTELRFTPNSRNIHRKWLPLAPGLGCAGLLFLDTPNKVLQLRSPKRMQGKSMGYNDESCSDDDLDSEHYGDQRNGDKTVTFTNVHGNAKLGADNYCRTLESLINLAPPPQEHYRFDSPKSQTILVTHYFNLDNKDKNRGEEDTDNSKSQYKHAPDRKEDSQPMPWPEEHTDFVESALAQEELPLEIASGHGAGLMPRHLKQGKVDLVIPGSLRERGEFCLVNMCLSERAVRKEKSPKVKPSFAWRVGKVEFYNMNRLP